MTYILGFKQPGSTAIISDTRITWGNNASYLAKGDNTALKTGFFFIGCNFGRIGSAEHSRDFITTFKGSLRKVKDTIMGFWQRFEEFVKLYDFPKSHDSHFTLLLSTRAFGEPKFFTLDSKLGYLKNEFDAEDNYILSFGSGKEVLDSYLVDEVIPKLQELENDLATNEAISKQFDKIDQAKLIITLLPYHICLHLSEKALTFEKSRLEEYQVGGLFHFIQQTIDYEAYQRPAIYIFSSADIKNSNVYSWIYRVVPVQGCLHIEEYPPAGQGSMDSKLLCDSASRLDILTISDNELVIAVKKELKLLPFYNFCGFGFTPPQYRYIRGGWFTTKGKEEDIFTSDNKLTQAIQQRINMNFDAVKDNYPE